jgi:AAA domain-containing protein
MTDAERDSLLLSSVKGTDSQNLVEGGAAKDLAVGHLFERSSVARELHAAGMLLRRGIGRVSVEEARVFARNDRRFVRLVPDQALAERQILRVDEAGFLSVKQMNWLVQFADRNGCRLILSGDTRQHHGVERGDALRILQNSGAVTQVVLMGIIRQQIEVLRQAVFDLSQSRTEAGFDKLDNFGAIHELEDKAERFAAIAQTHLAARKEGKSSAFVHRFESGAQGSSGASK